MYRWSSYRFGMFLLGAIIVCTTSVAFAQAPGLPADIQALLKKDPKTLTDEERAKLTQPLKFLSAQPGESVQSSESADAPGTVSCFDHYRFGSVQVDVSPTLGSTVPGATLGFTGKMKNDNDYPVVAGQVYAKIFLKKAQDEALTHQNGYSLVDQFVVESDLSLPAKGERDISFSWMVPNAAEAGDYQIAFYFNSAERYNLLGLSFTDDVTGNTADFKVVGEGGTAAAFDKNAVMLNGKPHRFAAFPLHFTKDELVTAEVKLVNPKDEEVTVAVTWKLYDWDGLREEARRDMQQEVILLKAKETKTLAYKAQPINASVSYLVVEVKDRDAKSILDIRFVRDGIEETRINFPSIETYPLKAGEKAGLFSCVHSTNQPVVKDNILSLTLRDAEGNVFHNYQYRGDITGNMMGLSDSFTPEKTYANFTLTATLERDGKLIEEVVQKYDCEKIDKTLCPKAGAQSIEGQKNLTKTIVMMLIIGLTILGFILIVVKKWRKN